MAGPIVERILRESGIPSLFEVLAERLAPTDLQSLLLAVFRRRAEQQTPARVLEQYARNRFVPPAPVSLQALAALDHLALTLAAPAFAALDLSPVCPLGTCAALGPVDPAWSVPTIRNTEVVSDSTNVLALECALRRRAQRQAGRRAASVRLCTSHRLLRAQHYQAPARAHFRIFTLCTAGRTAGDLHFELGALQEQLGFYLAFLAALPPLGYHLPVVSIAVTDLSGGSQTAAIEQAVFAPLAARFPGAELGFDPGRTGGRGYYERICFHIYGRDTAGTTHELGDGGCTDWTARLLGDTKERVLISGIATERLCGAFASG